MIMSSFYYEICENVVAPKQVKDMVAVLVFFDQQKGSVTSKIVRITEQLKLLTKRNINCAGYKFSQYFR